MGMEGMRKTRIFSIFFAMDKQNPVLARASSSGCGCALLTLFWEHPQGSSQCKLKLVHCLRVDACPGPPLDDGRNMERPVLDLDWPRN